MDIAGKLTYHFQEVLDEHACTLLRLAFCQDVGEPLADSAKHNRTMFKTSFIEIVFCCTIISARVKQEDHQAHSRIHECIDDIQSLKSTSTGIKSAGEHKKVLEQQTA